jgi:putative transport protein
MVSGVAYSILLFSLVIASGLWLAKFKIKGISIGTTWILFVGILVSHFGFRPDADVTSFMKDFGLILFVFSIGMQVGPGFFSSFKKGGVKLNLLAVAVILLAALTAVLISVISGEDLKTMVGVMSGAVTNTPGLGAAQQTLSDVMMAEGADRATAAAESSKLASAYAVAYPIGVIGVLFLLIIFKAVFKVDIEKEKAELDAESSESTDTARRMHCEVANPAVFGRTLSHVLAGENISIVVSRMLRDGVVSIPTGDTVLQKGDKLLIVTSQKDVDRIRIIFGDEIPMHYDDWLNMQSELFTQKMVVTRSEVTGKRIKDLKLREKYGVSVSRVVRAGLDLVARPDLILQVGDSLKLVGPKSSMGDVAKIIGNKPSSLTHPNLVPIFAGIALGIILGSVPIRFPDIPQPIKLGMAAGPLIVAILLSHFGPKWKITTYTTFSANMMLREIGISFFLAAVGFGAGETFVSSLMAGGFWWILYGALITLIPLIIVGVVGRLVFKLNFYQICGLISGSTTNPPVLAFAQGAYGTDYTSLNYATVYPLSMFLRVLVAQMMVLFALT